MSAARTGKWVIVDRDGVINRDSDDYIRSVSQWRPIDGSIEALAALSRAGIVVTVATNQSGIGRGFFSRDTVYRMHRKLRRLVAQQGGRVNEIAFCPHTPDDDCVCRKPRTGLLRRLSRRVERPLSEAVLIGDSASDLQAGADAGCELWLVATGNGVHTAQELGHKPTAWWPRVNHATDLADAAKQLLGGY